jgi:cation transporter-like permease
MKRSRLLHILFVIVSVGFASSISLIGGLGIEAVQNELIYIVPLLIALPAMNSLVGDYATLIAAHAGDPNERNLSKRQLMIAMFPSVITSTVMILGVSLTLAIHRGYHLQDVFILKYVLFVVSSIVSVIAIMFLLTALLDKLLENRDINPDDVLIPIVTTISDIFMLGLIALAVKFIF